VLAGGARVSRRAAGLSVWWSQPAGDALALACWVVDDKLHRGDALGRAL
jgi:hypothetical protein